MDKQYHSDYWIGLAEGQKQGKTDTLGSLSRECKVDLLELLETIRAVDEEGPDAELCLILKSQCHNLFKVMQREGVSIPTLKA